METLGRLGWRTSLSTKSVARSVYMYAVKKNSVEFSFLFLFQIDGWSGGGAILNSRFWIGIGFVEFLSSCFALEIVFLPSRD